MAVRALVHRTIFLIAAFALTTSCARQTPTVARPSTPPSPSPDAKWPWTQATETRLAKGFTHWKSTGADGSSLDLLQFDFQENSNLRFAIYDQDQDDAVPFDNRTDYFPKGAGQVTAHLNKDRKVLAAWNGLFFAYDREPGSPPNGWATHIGPVVIDGKAHFNVGRHRWMFGVQGQTFKALFKPNKKTMEAEFDFAADEAQLLIRQGLPLHIQPFEDTLKQARSSDSESNAGAIPIVDWMKTSRTSMAWSQDSRTFWVLIVVEADHEVASKLAVKYNREDPSGWTLTDLQKFWLSKGVWGAVNSDGGVVTQLAMRKPDASYELVPAQQSTRPIRYTTSDLANSPDGGSLLTFYVYESNSSATAR